MSAGNYGKVERGEISFNYSFLEAFADICKVSVTALISEKEEKWEAILAEKDKKIIELQQQIIQLLTEKRKKINLLRN
jgi:hypothetical protein